MKIILISSLCLGLAACSTPISKTEINNANFGVRPTDSDAILKITNYLNAVLIDPDSLKIKCSEVLGKSWAKQNQFDKPDYGYLVACTVNSKNRMGGYAGGKLNHFLINNSSVKLFDYTGFVVDPSINHFNIIKN